MRKCPVQARCQHLEVCEVFETCRSAEHMTYAELERVMAARSDRRPMSAENAAIIEEEFMRKARAT